MTDETMLVRCARALWDLECGRATADEVLAGRVPPERWADPWHPSGYGMRQQKPYLDQAQAVLDTLMEPSDRMLEAAYAALLVLPPSKAAGTDAVKYAHQVMIQHVREGGK